MDNPFATNDGDENLSGDDRPCTQSHVWAYLAFFLLGTLLMCLFLQATAISQLADGLLQPGDTIAADYGSEPEGTRVTITSSWLCSVPGAYFFVNLCICTVCAVICLRRNLVALAVMLVNILLCIAGIVLSIYFVFEVFVADHL